MDNFDDLLHRADQKRVKLLAQEMVKEYVNELYNQILRGLLRFAGEMFVVYGLIELLRS
jgi:mannose/fructose/N-acetylgalactosamine-specific phosphotransferase system component IIC